MTAPSATVVITTKDRRDDLRTAVRSALEQTAEPEVIVVDDGSSDGTAEMVGDEFPQARVERSEQSRGYIRQRNLAARLATGDVIFSIDDDAEFSAPDAVERTLSDFDHPRIGAVAIPFVHTTRSPEVLQRPPDDDGRYVTNVFIGTAHALRRETFLRLGGYREELEHFFEEQDWCLRLLADGHVVRLGRAAPILHHESPKRNLRRQARLVCRGHTLITWFDVPQPHALARAAELALYAPAYGLQMRHPGAAVGGVAEGIRMARRLRGRDPVPPETYRLYRRLRRGPLPLEQVEPLLPAAGTGRVLQPA